MISDLPVHTPCEYHKKIKTGKTEMAIMAFQTQEHAIFQQT